MSMSSSSTATLTSLSFLSLSQSQPSPLSLFSFPVSTKHAHHLFAKLPLSHTHTTKLLVSSNAEALDTGLLQHPSPSHSSPLHSQSTLHAVYSAVRIVSQIHDRLFKATANYLEDQYPEKTLQEIAESLLNSLISVKVVQADEDSQNLIFSEKEASWSRYSEQVKVGDIFEARVCSIEDYGAFVNLRFPDGLYHLTGIIHISEMSWDLVDDVRDILTEYDEVRVKVVSVDRKKSRISLSIKQLEEDPLLENLDIAPPQDGLARPKSLGGGNTSGILPLPGLGRILEELLQEDGIDDARIKRHGFGKQVVSQDLQLWLSNEPPTNQRFNLLARAGSQVQEIHLTTSLDQEAAAVRPKVVLSTTQLSAQPKVTNLRFEK
ncbi:hypothetical protein RIF29_41900 [Crotalaria pallida]|uniref:S1 motif domain-containing protein n=1 Tax=Crotalaria pallida TaxID=3830 RepID=A0AAN9E5Y3_CROPI